MKLKFMWLPSSPKGEIVGIMAQVLSLMATYTDNGSHDSRNGSFIGDIEEDAGNHCSRCATADIPCRVRVQSRRSAFQKVRPPSAHILRKRKALVGVSCNPLLVLSRRYCVITVLTRGIAP